MDATSVSNALADNDDVKVQKLSHAVADRLRAQIVSGQRKAGDRLPPESELLTQFKVSRPTIREALRILEVEALIALGRGARAGATVLGPTVERAAEYAAMVLVSSGTTVGELHEARAVLEPPMIQQLTKKRDRALLEQLEEHIRMANLAISDEDYQGALHHANDFHATLVRSSVNRALNLMVDMLKVLSIRTVDALLNGSEDDRTALRSNMIKTITVYQQLVELMRGGKADEAEAYWQKYMDRAKVFLDKSGVGARRLQHR
jgi:DNA-binding FadR family transcriptional regulator